MRTMLQIDRKIVEEKNSRYRQTYRQMRTSHLFLIKDGQIPSNTEKYRKILKNTEGDCWEKHGNWYFLKSISNNRLKKIAASIPFLINVFICLYFCLYLKIVYLCFLPLLCAFKSTQILYVVKWRILLLGKAIHFALIFSIIFGYFQSDKVLCL